MMYTLFFPKNYLFVTLSHHKIVREQNSEQEFLDQLKQKKVDLLAQQKHKTDQRCVLDSKSWVNKKGQKF